MSMLASSRFSYCIPTLYLHSDMFEWEFIGTLYCFYCCFRNSDSYF